MTLTKLAIIVAVIAVIAIVFLALDNSNPYAVPYAPSSQYQSVIKEAVDSSNPSICGRITFTNPLAGLSGISENLARELCYNDYLNAHPETNICPPAAVGCINQYAAIWNRPSLCNQNQGCVTNIADRYHNIQTCDLLVPSDAALCRRSYNPYNCHNALCVPGNP